MQASEYTRTGVSNKNTSECGGSSPHPLKPREFVGIFQERGVSFFLSSWCQGSTSLSAVLQKHWRVSCLCAPLHFLVQCPITLKSLVSVRATCRDIRQISELFSHLVVQALRLLVHPKYQRIFCLYTPFKNKAVILVGTACIIKIRIQQENTPGHADAWETDSICKSNIFIYNLTLSYIVPTIIIDLVFVIDS